MHGFKRIILIFALVFGACPATAQDPAAESIELSESGEAYLRTISRRINAGVAYYDPTRAAPELTTDARPERSSPADDIDIEPVLFSWNFWTILATVILAIVLFQVWRAGAPLAVSLRARPRDASRDLRPSHSVEGEEDAPPPGLAEILAMPDRNLAIIELARRALTHVAEQNDLRWQTSWTARELMRRLPAEAADRLRPLVRTAEHVQFGDRDVAEDEFQSHANQMTPLLSGGAA